MNNQTIGSDRGSGAYRLQNIFLLLFLVVIELVFFFKNAIFVKFASIFFSVPDQDMVEETTLRFSDFFTDISLQVSLGMALVFLLFDVFIIYKIIKDEPVLGVNKFKNEKIVLASVLIFLLALVFVMIKYIASEG